MSRIVTNSNIDPIMAALGTQRINVIARRGEAERAGQTDLVVALTTALGHIDLAIEAMEYAGAVAPCPVG